MGVLAIFRRGSDDDGNSKKDDHDKKKKKNRAKHEESEIEDYERKKFVNIRYRQWMYDRIDGVPRPLANKYDTPDPYPPAFLCLPPPVIKLCPFLLEENVFCRTVGGLGCCSADEHWARSAVMRYAFFLNIVGLGLMIYTSLSIADSNYDLLQYVSLARAELTPRPENFFLNPISLQLGLKAVTIDNSNTGLQEVVRFDQFCDSVGQEGGGIEKYIREPVEDTCHQCEDIQIVTVISMIVALVCFVPSMVAACSRMYLSTDVNCQKAWASVLAALSLSGCVLLWQQFTYKCLDVFYDGAVSYARNGEVVEANSIDEVVKIDFDWAVGYGMLSLYAAFGIKAIDFICNCCIPTPAITRNTYEQKIYELKAKEMNGEEDEENVKSQGNSSSSPSPSPSHDESSSSESS